MKLTAKQRELLLSKSYREIIERAEVGQSTIKRLRDNIDDMRLGTLERLLKKVWSISVKEFINLE